MPLDVKVERRNSHPRSRVTLIDVSDIDRSMVLAGLVNNARKMLESSFAEDFIGFLDRSRAASYLSRMPHGEFSYIRTISGHGINTTRGLPLDVLFTADGFLLPERYDLHYDGTADEVVQRARAGDLCGEMPFDPIACRRQKF